MRVIVLDIWKECVSCLTKKKKKKRTWPNALYTRYCPWYMKIMTRFNIKMYVSSNIFFSNYMLKLKKKKFIVSLNFQKFAVTSNF